MALKLAMIRSAEASKGCTSGLGLRRLTHSIARPIPLDSALGCNSVLSAQLVLPELDQSSDTIEPGFPSLPFVGGYMELMAVPRKKVSRHKRGIRNGPKALKPVPVIIRCKVCGRIKLPHFFCCSGERGNPGEQNGTTN